MKKAARDTSGVVILLLTVAVFSSLPGCIEGGLSKTAGHVIKGEVLRAASSYTDETGQQNSSIYVHDGSVDWSEGTLYGYLLPADVYDDSACGPKSNASVNDYQTCSEGAQQVADPFDIQQKNWLDEDNNNDALSYEGIFQHLRSAYSTFVGLMSPVEEGSPVAILEFIGVDEGTYDLLLIADVEQDTFVPNDGSGEVVSTRLVGCLPDDGPDCVTRDEYVGLPSNGDVVYLIDNVVVSTDPEISEKNSGLYLPGVDPTLAAFYGANAPEPNVCKGLFNYGSGDNDFWDEWVCIDHRHDLAGDPATSDCGALVDECWDGTDNPRAFPDN